MSAKKANIEVVTTETAKSGEVNLNDIMARGNKYTDELLKRKEELEKQGEDPESIAVDALINMMTAYRKAMFEVQIRYQEHLKLEYPPVPIIDDMIERENRCFAIKGRGYYQDNFYYEDFCGKFNKRKLRKYTSEYIDAMR